VTSFGALSDLVENRRALTINKALFFVLSKPESKALIIQLNTEGQLFLKGIDSEGRNLEDIGGGYADFTIQQKRFDSLPFDRVTLFDTGDFYNSFDVDVMKDSLTIEANTVKGVDDLRDRWGTDILGLTDESLTILIDELIPEIVEFIKGELLR